MKFGEKGVVMEKFYSVYVDRQLIGVAANHEIAMEKAMPFDLLNPNRIIFIVESNGRLGIDWIPIENLRP